MIEASAGAIAWSWPSDRWRCSKRTQGTGVRDALCYPLPENAGILYITTKCKEHKPDPTEPTGLDPTTTKVYRVIGL